MRTDTGKVAGQRRRSAVQLVAVAATFAVLFTLVLLWQAGGGPDGGEAAQDSATPAPSSTVDQPGYEEETSGSLCRTRSPGGPSASPPQEVEVTAGLPGKAPLAEETDVSWTAYAAGGSRLLTGRGASGTVTVWDARSGQRAAVMTGGKPGGGVLSGDGTRLVAPLGSAEDLTGPDPLAVWDVRRGGDPVWRLISGELREVWDYALDPGGTRLATAHGDGAVRLWEQSRSTPVAVLRGVGGVTQVAFSPDGTRLAAVHDGHEERASPGGNEAAGDREDRVVRLWDPAAHREMAELHGHIDEVTRLAFSPDGGTLATAGLDGTVFLWDAEKGTALRQLRPAEHRAVSEIGGVDFAADGATVMSTQMDGTGRLWDVATGQELRCFFGVPAHAWSVFCPEGALVMTIAPYGRADLWNMATGKRHTVVHDPGPGAGSSPVPVSARPDCGALAVGAAAPFGDTTRPGITVHDVALTGAATQD